MWYYIKVRRVCVTLIEFETKTVQKTVFNIPKSITTQFLYRPAQKPHKNWMIFFHRAGILFNEVQHVNLHNKIISETFSASKLVLRAYLLSLLI